MQKAFPVPFQVRWHVHFEFLQRKDFWKLIDNPDRALKGKKLVDIPLPAALSDAKKSLASVYNIVVLSGFE